VGTKAVDALKEILVAQAGSAGITYLQFIHACKYGFKQGWKPIKDELFLGEVPVPVRKENNAARFAEKELEAGRTGDVYDTVASMDELLRSAGFIMSLLEKSNHPEAQYVSLVCFWGCYKSAHAQSGIFSTASPL